MDSKAIAVKNTPKGEGWEGKMPENDFTMVPVVSSQIAAVGYNPETQVLRVEFANGALYEYAAVPQGIFDGLVGADSVGSFFHGAIKNGGYSYQRVG